MKKFIIIAIAATGIAGCTATEERAAGGALVGAGAGAVVGGAATGTGEGALIGAAVGGAAGALIGASTTPGYCVYERRDGTRYTARCP